MRCVVQRVLSASVTVEGETVGAIGPGLLALIGVSSEDGPADVKYIADKVMHLRIFDDENGVMNRSVLDAGGSILAVSQFTLYGDARGGRRPSYFRAAKPEVADGLYRRVIEAWRAAGLPVETGRFRTEMRAFPSFVRITWSPSAPVGSFPGADAPPGSPDRRCFCQRQATSGKTGKIRRCRS